MAKRLFNVRAYSDTAAKWATNTRIYPPNSLLIETDTGAIKRGDGVNTYADLLLIGAGTGADTSWGDIADKPATFKPSAHDHAWADITAKPVVIASGATQAEARTAIGAGTGNSNLEIGTTASTAKVGNYQPTWAQVTGKPTTFAPSAHDHEVVADATSGLAAAATIQDLAEALSARILALETPAG